MTAVLAHPPQIATDLALEAESLVKTYPAGRGKSPVHALDGLSLVVAPGTVFGLLGPNGAGKTTAVKIFSTLSRADSGSARVGGVDVRLAPGRVRRAIGLVAQRPSSDPMATGRENLVLAARIQGLARHDARARAAELLARFELSDAADRLVRTYSGGMARKLDVAIGLIHRPHVLFLDEPTTGLDPQARADMWGEIARLAADERVTVLLTTHYLDEADHLADRLAIVDRGRVVAEGTPDELKAGLRGDTVHIGLSGADDAARASEVLARISGIGGIVTDGATLHARTESGAAAVPALLTTLDAAGVGVASVTLARPSLDDVYLHFAGRSFEGAGA